MLEYTLLPDGTLRVERYTGEDDEVLVPQVAQGRAITQIAPCAFRGVCHVRRIILPPTVRVIGWEAFAGCRAEEIVLPPWLAEIGERAFMDCRFRRISLPDTLLSLPRYLFYGCMHLEEVKLPAHLQEIPEAAFCLCPELQRVWLPEGLRCIGESAFRMCMRMREIALPEGLEDIAANAFESCSAVREIRLPRSLRRVDPLAFGRRERHSITVRDIGVVYMTRLIPLAVYPGSVGHRFALEQQWEHRVIGDADGLRDPSQSERGGK